LPRSTHSKASSDFLHDKFSRASFFDLSLLQFIWYFFYLQVP
jgi:hypothetical protein